MNHLLKPLHTKSSASKNQLVRLNKKTPLITDEEETDKSGYTRLKSNYYLATPTVGKDIIYGNLNSDTNGTKDESRNDDALKEDMTLKESLKSASCDNDVEKEGTLKRSYRSALLGRNR